MAAGYFVVDEKDDYSIVEFVDSETKASHIRQINTFGLSLEQKHERYEGHERTFIYRVSIGMIKPETTTPTMEEPALSSPQPEETP
jgi:hypothetical protein